MAAACGVAVGSGNGGIPAARARFGAARPLARRPPSAGRSRGRRSWRSFEAALKLPESSTPTTGLDKRWGHTAVTVAVVNGAILGHLQKDTIREKMEALACPEGNRKERKGTDEKEIKGRKEDLEGRGEGCT